ncbi:hypothetical protein P872_19090 [Rhodonellum psychrophilum GCM71 = DSM 17998]|uniref:Uncharacterized protein n=1 Tax=Rhodonellum psychrophilum GCM71 = DSM 17998 TaxID=1123057 RepID=U5BYP0_9BACT|nr:hypothetical protein P872_19090 [Rhodonellum psychrophilum GCM71 = DSM 17998]
MPANAFFFFQSFPIKRMVRVVQRSQVLNSSENSIAEINQEKVS